MAKKIDYINILEFYKGKRVLVTGHTGFKGSWLCKILLEAGAELCGYALEPPTGPSLFNLLDLSKKMKSVIGDISNLPLLKKTFDEFNPQVVFHMAAQPLVRLSYDKPLETYQTNVMGTVNILECVRLNQNVKSFVNITTDKVYLNREWHWGYREDEQLDGFDPYSNSKSCSELVTHSYYNSFFANSQTAISTVRAGNVIGGGDFAIDRIIPDCVRAAIKKEPLVMRNPNSVRPYQHVLEPLFAYLLLGFKQFTDKNFSGWYNIGPDDNGCVSTGELVKLFCDIWQDGASFIVKSDSNAVHESTFLKLDCAKFKAKFKWEPSFSIKKAIEKTVDFYKAWHNGSNFNMLATAQIEEYVNS